MTFTDGMRTSSKKDYGTPWELYRPIDEVYQFEVDVCAHAGNAKCERYFTEEEDALSLEWSPLVCWMNPPYGPNLTGSWTAKAAEESKRGAVVVALVPARTDTKWWYEAVKQAAHVVFLHGRVQHLGDDGTPIVGTTFPSALIIFDSSSSTRSVLWWDWRNKPFPIKRKRAA